MGRGLERRRDGVGMVERGTERGEGLEGVFWN